MSKITLYHCPKCGAKESCRERRINGNATCENGHKYPSKDAIGADEHLQIELAKTEYVVEANSFEYLSLWKDFHEEYSWEQVSQGYGAHVGYIDGRPIFISLRWATVNEVYMLFWHATSKVVDYGMIEEWFVNNCDPMANGRHARCDADNFIHAILCNGLLKRKVEQDG